MDIIRGFVVLDEQTQQRNILAWKPVVVDVLEGYVNFPEADFGRHINTFYPLAVDLLGRELGRDTRAVLQGLLRRVGEIRGLGYRGAGEEAEEGVSLPLEMPLQVREPGGYRTRRGSDYSLYQGAPRPLSGMLGGWESVVLLALCALLLRWMYLSVSILLVQLSSWGFD